MKAVSFTLGILTLKEGGSRFPTELNSLGLLSHKGYKM